MPATEPPPPSSSVDELVAAERLREAAALCQATGEAARAVDLLERAAAFDDAARLAVEQGMGARALRLAAMAGRDALIAEIAQAVPAADAIRAGADLASRGQHRAAAHAFAAAGEPLRAAEAWERASEPVRSAEQYRAAGDAVRAARALTSRLEERPDDAAAALLLGRVLVENGRFEAAAAALQRVALTAKEAAEARPLLALSLDRLGLREARASLGDVAPAALPETARLTAAPLLFGRYEVEATVATTPTARVLRCVDRLSGARVAVKMLRPGAGGQEGRDAIGRFAREARALALLRHPHVLPLFSFLPEGPAVVTPWMAGGSFADLRLAGGLLPARSVEITLAVLGALDEAHRIGVLHRDVKPSNVLLDGAGAPYLADFGAAHVGDAAATVTAGLIGSLAYMAPEQLAAQPATIASDIYAAGAMLYEALTGEPASPADQISQRPSDVWPDLGGRHDAVVSALLARDPTMRPESAAAAAALLRGISWRTDRPSRARDAGPASSVRGPQRRLSPLDGGAAWDTLLARRVLVLPADAPTVAMARAFARAGAPALATVYRADVEARAVWVEDPPGNALTVLARPLTPAEANELGDALAALHREGVAHGSVDADHVRVDPSRGPVLLFPEGAPRDAPPEADLSALGELCAGGVAAARNA